MIQQAFVDTAHAKRNRRIVAEKVGEHFYRQQEAICRGWEWDTYPPAGLRLGELPQVDVGTWKREADYE